MIATHEDCRSGVSGSLLLSSQLCDPSWSVLLLVLIRALCSGRRKERVRVLEIPEVTAEQRRCELTRLALQTQGISAATEGELDACLAWSSFLSSPRALHETAGKWMGSMQPKCEASRKISDTLGPGLPRVRQVACSPKWVVNPTKAKHNKVRLIYYEASSIKKIPYPSATQI